MVSGPDFFVEHRWRRVESAPIVTPMEFARSFARRIESMCQQDWTALPIIRSVAFKWTAEHTMATGVKLLGRHGNATDTHATKYIEAARNLFHHLHNGHIQSGLHRIPIAGDTNKLPFAKGLTPLEKKMAFAQNFIAQQMAGTQQLRQLMGHTQFGARVLYGDCMFFTISPNEQHSALVLRLVRRRQKDPFVQHGNPAWKRLTSKDYPFLEQTHTERL